LRSLFNGFKILCGSLHFQLYNPSASGAGCEVICLKDVISPDSTDLSVIVKTQELDSVLVSLNGDFSDMVAYLPKNYKGIVALQC
jgi:hypothetical protein